MSGPHKDIPNADSIEMDDVAEQLAGLKNSFAGIAEQAKKAMAMFPSLNMIEKRQIKIGKEKAAVSLLERGGILIEFESPEAARKHFDTQYAKK